MGDGNPDSKLTLHSALNTAPCTLFHQWKWVPQRVAQYPPPLEHRQKYAIGLDDSETARVSLPDSHPRGLLEDPCFGVPGPHLLQAVLDDVAFGPST